ncbi:MAG: DEAD/DEAH box helicase [Deltaproteobacteria bacterium]|nr:DEAD/DEAH box helicase [Deltaproteobacteria bacterium]
MNFSTLGLTENIIKAIGDLGFDTPTPIQEKVIPQILTDPRDIVGLAQTGTGKTAAYGLPILERTDISSKRVQTLILCPTRELCLQIAHDMESFSRFLPKLSVTAVYGGAGIIEQMRSVRKGTQIIVATPGRLLDLINRKAADISSIRHLVLDEADIMLNMGFKEELDAILAAAPTERQTLLFSATMPSEVAKIAAKYMKNPIEISVGQKNSGTANVEHQYFMVHARDKYETLKRVVDYYPEIYGIIFCRTRISTQEIADKMIKDGYNAEALHGDLSQSQREFVMRKFREGNVQLLIATDIAARGLDVNNLTHVIHYDLPDDLEIYTHRSGRTGRAGKTGISLAIIHMKEKYKIGSLEKTVKRKITATKVPLGKDICEQQLIHLIDRVKAVDVDSDQIMPYLAIIEKKLADLDREALLKHFVSLEFNRFLNYYKNAPDLTAVQREVQKKKPDHQAFTKSGSRECSKSEFTYLVVNIGMNDHVLPPQIIGLINQSTRNRFIRLGNIDISPNSSRFQIENNYVDEVYKAISGYKFCGKKLRVEREDSGGENRKKRWKKSTRNCENFV